MRSCGSPRRQYTRRAAVDVSFGTITLQTVCAHAARRELGTASNLRLRTAFEAIYILGVRGLLLLAAFQGAIGEA